MTQIVLLNLVYIDAVLADLAGRNIVKPVDKICYGRFACARCADKSNLLSRLGIESYIVKNNLFGIVAEVHILHTHIAHQLGIGDCAVLVRMLPRTCTSSFLSFNELAVNLLCIDERNITVVNFRFFVHKLKNSVRTGKSHNDAVDVLRDLTDVVGELACHIEERHDDSNGECLT